VRVLQPDPSDAYSILRRVVSDGGSPAQLRPQHVAEPARGRPSSEMSCATRPARRVGLRVQDYPDRPRPQLVRVLPRCCHNSHPPWIESLHQSRGGTPRQRRHRHPSQPGVPAGDGRDRRRAHLHRYRRRPQLHLRTGQRRVPDPRRGRHRLRHRPAPRGFAARAKRTDLLAGFITDTIVTAGGD